MQLVIKFYGHFSKTPKFWISNPKTTLTYDTDETEQNRTTRGEYRGGPRVQHFCHITNHFRISNRAQNGATADALPFPTRASDALPLRTAQSAVASLFPAVGVGWGWNLVKWQARRCKQNAQLSCCVWKAVRYDKSALNGRRWWHNWAGIPNDPGRFYSVNWSI